MDQKRKLLLITTLLDCTEFLNKMTEHFNPECRPENYPIGLYILPIYWNY